MDGRPKKGRREEGAFGDKSTENENGGASEWNGNGSGDEREEG